MCAVYGYLCFTFSKLKSVTFIAEIVKISYIFYAWNRQRQDFFYLSIKKCRFANLIKDGSMFYDHIDIYFEIKCAQYVTWS